MNNNILNLKPSISTPITSNSKSIQDSSGSILLRKENSDNSLPVKLSSSEINLHNSSVKINSNLYFKYYCKTYLDSIKHV